MSTASTSIIVGVLFLLIFLSGLWLSRSGRPLQGGISAIHKLVSLGAGVLLLVAIYQRNEAAPLGATAWMAIAATGLCFLADVASGALLSSEAARPVAVLRIHQIAPVLTVVLSGATLYLLLG